ncbi:hypothetical protein [Yinghuangia soli]|uniref:Uncharacterized protein n=1 Tax=Yinghuangia soli TaxID=2908204 RepID=A0AA41PUC5_9ACTN|nr:hypothetical protein [Yinghuangia soli]MCF2526028.1 hypothetical protein [Yinghuangia soli]
MDDLLGFLVGRIMDDNHAYAFVADTMGGEALLDSHLPMLDLIWQLANDHKAMDATDARSAGVEYALRVLTQAYDYSAAYREEWRP